MRNKHNNHSHISEEKFKSMNKIPILIASLIAIHCIAGCRAIYPKPTATNCAVNEKESIDLALGCNTTNTNSIEALIFNMSDCAILVNVSVDFGIGFDMEYMTVENELKYLNGTLYGEFSPSLTSLHLLKPARRDDDGVVRGFPPLSFLSLSLEKPEDFYELRRLECNVRYIKISDLDNIKNEKELIGKLFENQTAIRKIKKGLILGVDVFDSQSNSVESCTIPIPAPKFRGRL